MLGRAFGIAESKRQLARLLMGSEPVGAERKREVDRGLRAVRVGQREQGAAQIGRDVGIGWVRDDGRRLSRIPCA